jgi:Homeodomain-like domain
MTKPIGRRIGRPPMPKSDLMPTPGQKGLARPRSRATATAKAAVLKRLAEGSSITDAAKAIGRSRRTLHEWRDRDAKFASDWADVLECGADELEAEARRRAVDGVEEPMVSAGKLVCTVRKYSDTLLLALLRAHRPEKFGRPTIAASAEAEAPEGGKVVVRFKIDGHVEPMAPE